MLVRARRARNHTVNVSLREFGLSNERHPGPVRVKVGSEPLFGSPANRAESDEFHFASFLTHLRQTNALLALLFYIFWLF